MRAHHISPVPSGKLERRPTSRGKYPQTHVVPGYRSAEDVAQWSAGHCKFVDTDKRKKPHTHAQSTSNCNRPVGRGGPTKQPQRTKKHTHQHTRTHTQAKTSTVTNTPAAPGPVDDEHRALDPLYPIDVREQVPRYGEAEVEGHPKRRGQGALQHHAPQLHPDGRQLLRQLARRPAAQRPPIPVARLRLSLGLRRVHIDSECHISRFWWRWLVVRAAWRAHRRWQVVGRRCLNEVK